MTELNPIVLKEKLHTSLARYIATAAPVSPQRAFRLSEKISRALLSESANLVTGPFLESLPDFEKGPSLEELVQAGKLSSDWNALSNTPEGAELFRRRLHTHQSLAFEQADANYLVATGTGSGKTEAFLFPMIDALLKDPTRGQPGVKAILVYPLNALANDQMQRIARLLFRELGDPGLTIGRFTGQVRASATREQEAARLLDSPSFERDYDGAREVPKNWLLSRNEMFDNPPNILVTNYAMLEHILLLPKNRALLRDADLKFVVLDEIHTYSGAQAIEVAFLLRKLKTRLGLPQGSVRCIGTSASLDENRKAELVSFASQLFGEPFPDGELGVIVSKRLPHPHLSGPGHKSGLSAEQWIQAGSILERLRKDDLLEDESVASEWNRGLREAGLNLLTVVENEPFGSGLLNCLGKIPELRTVVERLDEGARPFRELAASLFPESEARRQGEALAALISIGLLAKPSIPGAFPLLPARYHFAVSGIEGAALRLSNDNDEHWGDLKFGRSISSDDGVPYYPLFVCRNCGEPYIETWEVNGTLYPKRQPFSDRKVLRLVAKPGDAAYEVESDEQIDEVDTETISFDPQNGEIAFEPNKTSLKLVVAEMAPDQDERSAYIVRSCSSCGARGGRYAEPITGLHPGDDAFAAVAAQILLEALPVPSNRDLGAPMGGRNLLSFSDNRQDAAFLPRFLKGLAATLP